MVRLNADMLNFFHYSSIATDSMTVALNSVTIYLIAFHSGRQDRVYKYYVLLSQVIALVMDLSWSLVIGLLFVLPLPCILTDGIVARAVSGFGYWIIPFALACFCANFFAYGLCFVYRHQAVMTPGSKLVLSRSQYNGLHLFFLVCCSVIPIQTAFSEMDPQQFKIIVDDSIYGLSANQKRRILCLSQNGGQMLFGFGLIGAFLASLCNLITCVQIFRTLASHATLSPRAVKYHRQMTKILLIQVSIPSLFLIVPNVMNCVMFSFQIENQLINHLDSVVMSLHSSANCIVTVMTGAPYRRALASFFCRCAPNQVEPSKKATASFTSVKHLTVVNSL